MIIRVSPNNIMQSRPINIGAPPQPSGLPKTWNPPCPAGEHYLKVLERVNGADGGSSDEEEDGRRSCSAAMGDQLIAAAKEESCARMASLLDTNVPVDVRDANGGTALSWSAKLGHCQGIALLLSRSADVDAVDKMGWSPLQEAAGAAEADAVAMLLAAGANPRLENRSMESAMSHARERRSAPCIALLRGALSPEEVAIDAAKNGDADHLDAMLDGCATSIQRADAALSSQRHHRERSSLLHWASCNGHLACAQLLLRRKANVDAHAVNGWTPLMAAVTSHEAAVVQLLCGARASLHLRDSTGKVALDHASKPTGSPECAELLRRAVADLDRAQQGSAKKDDGSASMEPRAPLAACTCAAQGASSKGPADSPRSAKERTGLGGGRLRSPWSSLSAMPCKLAMLSGRLFSSRRDSRYRSGSQAG